MSAVSFDRLDRDLQEGVDAGLAGVVAAVSVEGETVFSGAAGVRVAGQPGPMTSDTVLTIASMTKAITSVAAMQLVESGDLALDAPVGDVLDDLAMVQVLEAMEPDGTPQLRPARRPITLRHLLTHTSGFVYEMWNAELANYLTATGTPSMFTLKKAALRVPLMFDPGEHWEYGIGVDWVGQLIEAITNRTLGEHLADHVLEPLGMTSTCFTPTEAMADRMAGSHLLTETGCVSIPRWIADAPEFEMGGGGLVSTVPDYLRFTNMILNQGSLDGVQILRADTVAQMSCNNIGDLAVVPLTSINPQLTCDVDLLPGQTAKYGLGFIINTERTPQGRPAGSLAWAGLLNSFFWIDPSNKICAVWATQAFPFAHPAAVDAFARFESSVYNVSRERPSSASSTPLR